MVLLDATDLAQPVIATPKGLYADVPRVTGMSSSLNLMNRVLFEGPHDPGHSSRLLVSQAGYNTFTMANGNVAMTIRDGRIVSIFDKAHE